MVVDEQGEFVSQRELPRMALISPNCVSATWCCARRACWRCTWPWTRWKSPESAGVGRRSGCLRHGRHGGAVVQDFLGQKLRLVRFDPEVRRLSSLKWTGGVEAPNQFSDGYPVLVASEASLWTG
jgi:uncharacterized protein YcbX